MREELLEVGGTTKVEKEVVGETNASFDIFSLSSRLFNSTQKIRLGSFCCYYLLYA